MLLADSEELCAMHQFQA